MVSDTINRDIPVNSPQSRTRPHPDTQVLTVYSSCTEEILIASLKQLATESAHARTVEELATESTLLRTGSEQERTAASDRGRRLETKITSEKELKQCRLAIEVFHDKLTYSDERVSATRKNKTKIVDDVLPLAQAGISSNT